MITWLGLNPKNKKVRNFCHFLAEVLVLKNTNIFYVNFNQSAQQSTIKTIYNNLCLQKKMRFRNFLTFYRKILRTENCLKAYSIGFKTGHGLITRQGDNFLIRVRNISIYYGSLYHFVTLDLNRTSSIVSRSWLFLKCMILFDTNRQSLMKTIEQVIVTGKYVPPRIFSVRI